MRCLRSLSVAWLFTAALFGLVVPASAAQAPSIAGAWTGAIATPGRPLNVSVTLANDAAGAWTGTIDIPAQGAKGVVLDQIAVADRAVSFRIRGVPGNPLFNGRMSDDGNRISGTFAQGPAAFPFELTRGGAKAANRPQEPKPPFPYTSEEVRYRNDVAGIQLAGTLTLPVSSTPTSAVVLISGSGPQDRDGTLFEHKPFLVLADHLTRAGIAVLRVDDRGIGGSDRGPATATTEDFVSDVLSGVAYLKSRPEIDKRRVGLVGHSEGAMIAPIAAVRSSDVAFIVMLAGTGVPGDQILLGQAEAMLRGQAMPPAVIAWDKAMRERVYGLVKSETANLPDAAARRALVDSIAPIPGAPDASGARAQATALLNASSLPWFRFFLSYDPRTTLRQVTCPVLALGGSLDIQVVAAQNLPEIEAALKSSGNRDVTVTTLPGLNHLFQTARTGGVDEYGSIEETIAPSVLQLVTEWLRKRK